MRSVAAILAAAIAISLAGCVLRGKQPAVKAAVPPPKPVTETAPPPPKPKLSVPQTNVELPPPQPVNLDALAQAPAPEEPPPTTPSPNRPRNRPSSAAPRTEAPPQVPVVPPPQPPEPERGPIQEIVPAGDMKRFQEETVNRRKEINVRLEQASHRRLNDQERQLVDRVSGFLKQSEAAEARNDWRQAYELAGLGLTLARELTGGK